MADESERIHETIVATRHDLETKLERLSDELRRRVDVRQRIAERPWLALGGSIAVGFAVGRVSGARSRSAAAGSPREPSSRSILTHVAFALLSGIVREVVDRQVPRLVARACDRSREMRRTAVNGASLSEHAGWDARGEVAQGPAARDRSHGNGDAQRPAPGR